jgi:hypothetical protein
MVRDAKSMRDTDESDAIFKNKVILIENFHFVLKFLEQEFYRQLWLRTFLHFLGVHMTVSCAALKPIMTARFQCFAYWTEAQNTTPSSEIISELLIGNNVEGIFRGLNGGTVPEFTSRGWGKPQKETSVKIAVSGSRCYLATSWIWSRIANWDVRPHS